MHRSYLDQVLALMFEHTLDRIDPGTASLIAEHLLWAFNRTRDRQEEGERLWAARCMVLVQICQKVKRMLRGKELDDVEALEGVLIHALTKVPKNLCDTKSIIP